MSINTYFTDFLSNIRLSDAQKQDLIKGHTLLRERLADFDDLKDDIVTTFLQGSYRRATAVSPLNGKRADVDLIVVTNLKREDYSAEEAIAKFIPFVEKHYKGKYRIQGRSIGIELSYVDLDIVVTSAPSEADKKALLSESVRTQLSLEDFPLNYDWRLADLWVEPDLSSNVVFLSEAARKTPEWKLSALYIPDREAEEWVQTHPLEQIRWTQKKNKATNGHYVNVVKALKWWRTGKLTDLKYPKGYPIEHMIGDCCPDGITSVAEGICLTMESIVSTYSLYRNARVTPTLPDRGVPDHDVWKRVSADDFCTFYDAVKDCAKSARKALDSSSLKEKVEIWRDILGSKFPKYEGPNDSDAKNTLSSGPYTPRTKNSEPTETRFA
ncbi:MAG: hypothetical protein JNM21_14525 [Taibaiella sp.]|nr:hypothetical protein [Taibaiella sp.]